MSLLAPLLEVQELDLAAGRLREARAGLPERAELAANEAATSALAEASRAAQARRDALARAEREQGGEVAAIAARAKELETNLYSGSITIAKELDALQHELDLWKQKQADAEERELELLEAIDAVDAELAGHSTRRETLCDEAAEVAARLASAEALIDGEVTALETQAAALRSGLPDAVLAEYDRLRANPRLGGRAAAALGDGACEGCRLTLPMTEYGRVRDEPADAVVRCVHCSRLLVR